MFGHVLQTSWIVLHDGGFWKYCGQLQGSVFILGRLWKKRMIYMYYYIDILDI